MSVLNNKKTLKNIAIIVLLIVLLPLFSILTNIIYSYGTYFGTIDRNIVVTKTCP